MVPELLMPKKKEELAKYVDEVANRAKRVRNTRSVTWWLVHYYLQGCRDFSDVNYLTGDISAYYPNTEGVAFKHEEVVRKYQEEVGQLLRLSTAPQVTRRGHGLNAMRKASVSQVVLDDCFPRAVVEQVKNIFIPLLARYGTAALLTDYDVPDTPDADIGSPPRHIVVPPWELLPVPSNPATDEDVRGIIRERWVNLEWLRGKGFQQAVDANKDKMTIQVSEKGEKPEGLTGSISTDLSGQLAGLLPGSNTNRTVGGKDENFREYALIREMWVKRGSQYLSRYIITSGSATLEDKSFAPKTRRLLPIHIARYVDCGGFWGRGYVELMLPASIQAEELMKSLFQNIEELDLFGYLVVPGDLGVDLNQLTPAGGPRVLRYEPSPYRQTAEPFNIAPTNLGTLPGQVAEIALGLMDRVGPTSDVLQGRAPGRADSGVAFNTLFELSTIPLSMPVASIVGAYSGAYQSSLDVIRATWTNQRVAVSSMMDDAVAGIVIDTETGTLDKEQNAVPHPYEVDVSIEGVIPKTDDQKVSMLIMQLKSGLITPRWFRIMARKSGLDLLLANEAEWQNYRKAMYNNILLFNDGETPREKGVVVSPGDMHVIHLEVLDAFMARPEFQVAGIQVQQAFETHRDRHRELLGTLPSGMPNIEDAAEASGGAPGMNPQMMQQLLGGVGGG